MSTDSPNIPDWYAAEAGHCLRHVWRQGVTDEQLARAYRAYIAAAPTTERDPGRSEPTGWPSGAALTRPRQRGGAPQ